MHYSSVIAFTHFQKLRLKYLVGKRFCQKCEAKWTKSSLPRLSLLPETTSVWKKHCRIMFNSLYHLAQGCLLVKIKSQEVLLAKLREVTVWNDTMWGIKMISLCFSIHPILDNRVNQVFLSSFPFHETQPSVSVPQLSLWITSLAPDMINPQERQITQDAYRETSRWITVAWVWHSLNTLC